MNDHVAVAELALHEVTDARYNKTSIAVNHCSFESVFDGLHTYAETKRFVWSASRTFATKATLRMKQEVSFGKHKCTKRDDCAKCKRGLRPMYLDDYRRVFLGTTPCGGHHATVTAIATCLLPKPHKCLGCTVRVAKVEFAQPSTTDTF